MVFKGSCICKACTVELQQSPAMVYRCHCSLCQRITGSDFAVNCRAPPDQVVITGKENLFGYKATGSVIRYFCKTCANRVYGARLDDDGNEQSLVLPVGILGRKPGSDSELAPRADIFYEFRAADTNDDLPKWKGMVDQSERMN